MAATSINVKITYLIFLFETSTNILRAQNAPLPLSSRNQQIERRPAENEGYDLTISTGRSTHPKLVGMDDVSLAYSEYFKVTLEKHVQQRMRKL